MNLLSCIDLLMSQITQQTELSVNPHLANSGKTWRLQRKGNNVSFPEPQSELITKVIFHRCQMGKKNFRGMRF